MCGPHCENLYCCCVAAEWVCTVVRSWYFKSVFKVKLLLLSRNFQLAFITQQKRYCSVKCSCLLQNIVFYVC